MLLSTILLQAAAGLSLGKIGAALGAALAALAYLAANIKNIEGIAADVKAQILAQLATLKEVLANLDDYAIEYVVGLLADLELSIKAALAGLAAEESTEITVGGAESGTIESSSWEGAEAMAMHILKYGLGVKEGKDVALKHNGKFEIKGGFMDGKFVDMATVNALASIPALPVLQAQVLGTMLAPISALACVLKQIAEKNGAPAEVAAEEAPAAE